MSDFRRGGLFAVFAVLALAGCTGPEQNVRYACSHGMILNVTYEEGAERARIGDTIGQVRVLPEISSDATGTVYRDASVTFIRSGNTATYAANDSSHQTETCVARTSVPISPATPAPAGSSNAGNPG
jgi:membrane-bound inhibitor of C-type lysozyme